MTSDVRALAWCYLTAALSACVDEGGDEVQRHVDRFCELVGCETVDLHEFLDVREARTWLLAEAERFAEQAKGG